MTQSTELIAASIKATVTRLAYEPDARPRLIAYMRRNGRWYRKIIAQAWQDATCEPWGDVFDESLEGQV